MKVQFLAAPPASAPRLVAHIVDQDSLPQSLDSVLAEGARASRFSGKAGQVFDGFIAHEGRIIRVALAGAGDKDAKDRTAALERAGAALTARFLTSGETAMTLVLDGSELSAEELAAVLLGARLRGWRYDAYRTKLSDEQKASLQRIDVVGAPKGSEAVWS
ncbi:MAG: leucyl aminopeptidase, partial [Novosphingobium sp.]|nr:leucyl aminopeptidase [Novosphingobium sp.]